MGIEKDSSSAVEEDDGAGNAGAAEAASCMVRRYVIDPGMRVVRDGSGNTVAALMDAGGEALEAGSAGARFAAGIGRRLVGAEAPEPPAPETAEP